MRRLRDFLGWLLGTPGGRRALAFGSMFAATSALAAGGGAHPEPHVNWWTWDQHAPPVGWFFLDFVMFVGLLVFFLKNPVRAMFQKRHQDIKQGLDEAGALLARARGHHDEYRSKVQRIEQEVQALIEGAKQDGASERGRIVAAARDYVERLRQDAQQAAGQETRDSEQRLLHEAVNAVVAAAEQSLRRELKKDDQVRLLEQSIAALEDKSVPLTRQAPVPEAVA